MMRIIKPKHTLLVFLQQYKPPASCFQPPTYLKSPALQTQSAFIHRSSFFGPHIPLPGRIDCCKEGEADGKGRRDGPQRSDR